MHNTREAHDGAAGSIAGFGTPVPFSFTRHPDWSRETLGLAADLDQLCVGAVEHMEANILMDKAEENRGLLHFN